MMEALEPVVVEAAERLVTQLEQIGAESDQWRAADVAYPRLAKALDDCLATLAATNVWGIANRVPSGLFWNIASERLQHGEMLHRARFKPRGYAGDDVLLARMCDQWQCEHPLGRLIDVYFQQHAAPQAVRNRTEMVAAALVEQIESASSALFRIVSIGSGPAIDIERAVERIAKEHRDRLQVSLLDLDQAALTAAEQRLSRQLAPHQIVCHRENLFRLPQRASKLGLAPANMIFSTGFFDYLPTADATALLAHLWQSLQPQGRLLVFNFAPQHPSQALMEWLGNWYLIYRDAEQMHTLANQAGIAPTDYRLTAEPLGIDLAIDATRP